MNANQFLKKNAKSNSKEVLDSSPNQVMPTNADFLDYISESVKIVSSSYGVFKKKAAYQVILYASFLVYKLTLKCYSFLFVFLCVHLNIYR